MRIIWMAIKRQKRKPGRETKIEIVQTSLETIEKTNPQLVLYKLWKKLLKIDFYRLRLQENQQEMQICWFRWYLHGSECSRVQWNVCRIAEIYQLKSYRCHFIAASKTNAKPISFPILWKSNGAMWCCIGNKKRNFHDYEYQNNQLNSQNQRMKTYTKKFFCNWMENERISFVGKEISFHFFYLSF